MTNLPYGERSSNYVKDLDKLYVRFTNNFRFGLFLEAHLNLFEEVYIIAPIQFVQRTRLSWTEKLFIDNNGIKVSLY